MTPPLSFAVQIGVVMIPAVLFITVKRRVTAVGMRLSLGLLLAVAAGGCTFYLAKEQGWRPIAKSGRSVDLEPITLFVINTLSLMLVFVVLTFAKKKAA